MERFPAYKLSDLDDESAEVWLAAQLLNIADKTLSSNDPR